jgi:D-alanyl-D-alanine carboxypeptidase
VDAFRSSRLVPGASVAVIDHGRLVEVVSGVADSDTGRAVTPHTEFRVASVTKLYVATVALALVERGDLALDEPIDRRPLVLPESLAFARQLTLRQLLSHTSGLSQTFTRDQDRHRSLTTADLLERIPPPACAPGTCWSYADGNYVLAGLVVEAATGQPLAEVLHEQFLGPLGLAETRLVDAAAVDEPLPAQYALVSDQSGRALEPRRLFRQSLPRTATLLTTAADAARFASALFGGEVLGPAGLQDMLETSLMRDLPCPDRCPFEYGLGVFHYDVFGHELVGHDGSSGTVVVHDRHRALTVAILTNGGEQDMGAFLGTVLAAIDDSGG